MFTWICPQCGREVLPSYTECPDCAAKAKAAQSSILVEPAQPPAHVGILLQPAPSPSAPPAEPPVAPQPPYPPPSYPPSQYTAPPPYAPQGQYPPQAQYPPQGQYAPPQASYPPPYAPPPQYAPQPQYTPQPQYGPRPSLLARVPTPLLTLVFALAFVGLVWGVYKLVGGSQAAAPPSNVESPAAKPAAKTSAVQKYVEISGVRFTENTKKAIMVKFILTNHSDADLSGLTGNATIWGRTQKSEEDAVGTFSFKTDVGPGASQEVTAPLTTKLKIYELPDWQNVTTDLQVTSPQ
jgi:hypothetical protein